MKKRIVKKLQTLKTIRPNREWTAATRDVLLSQIRSQGATASVPGTIAGIQAYARDIFGNFYRNAIMPIASHPGAVASVALSLVFGAGVAHIAAQSALPGDTLYSVKKTSEGLQLVLAPTNERAALYLAITEKRLQELDSIAGQSISEEEKAQKVATLAQEVGDSIANVQTNLEASNTGLAASEAVKIAHLVGQKSASYSESLKKAKDSLPTQDDNKSVAEAITRVEEANAQALGVIVDKKDESEVTDQELSDKLAETIKRAQGTAEEVNSKVTAAAEEQKIKKESAQDKTDAAKKALKEAEASLAKKDFKLAHDKIVESQELLDSAQKDIQ